MTIFCACWVIGFIGVYIILVIYNYIKDKKRDKTFCFAVKSRNAITIYKFGLRNKTTGDVYIISNWLTSGYLNKDKQKEYLQQKPFIYNKYDYLNMKYQIIEGYEWITIETKKIFPIYNPYEKKWTEIYEDKLIEQLDK